MSKHILVINGANLNLLGKREPEIYGTQTLADIEADLRQQAEAAGVRLTFVQSNSEAVLIDSIQYHGLLAEGDACIDAVIINPAAFTHTSVALRDALLAVDTPFIEVHLSNIHRREPFRQHSYFSDKALAVICGLGAQGYQAALAFFIRQFAANA